jgi:methylated-DNA-[protein]-cysteine S-methyltransferase
MYYTYLDSPVGPFLVAGDDNGLRFTSFSTAYQQRRQQSDWIEDAGPLQAATEQLTAYFSGEAIAFDLSLLPQGTAFQQSVWQVLQTIPFGQTCSYGEVARLVGRPGASRAVGAANAANHLPIVIPCHRVIGADGRLTGFGGGMETKQRLLELENALPLASRQRGLF